MFKRISAMVWARNKEFLRDRAALGWNLAFPFLVVAGFGFAYNNGPKPLFKIGVVTSAASIDTSAHPMLAYDYLTLIPISDVEVGKLKVDRHQLDMLIQIEPNHHYWINSTSPNGYFLEKLLLSGPLTAEWPRETLSGKEIRYVDWLLPGMLALNSMFSCLFGIGYVIVRYRKNGVLKRLKATPLTAFEFLTSQVVSRLILNVCVTVFVFFGCKWVIGIPVNGSYALLFLILVLGTLCLITMGLLVASRVASEEFAGGMLNMLTWPMMFLSGVWFSLDGMASWLPKAASIFPLTHFVQAWRAVMLDGASFVDVSGHLGYLGGLAAILLVAGSVLFRWE